jgi:RND family efflux transporter MFP subunit
MNKNFSQQWLEITCSILPDVESAIFMIPDHKTKQLRPLAKWPADFKNLNDFTEIVKYALKKRDQVFFPQVDEALNQTFDFYAKPVFVKNTLSGVLVVKTKQLPEDFQKGIFSRLNQSVRWLSLGSNNQDQGDDFYSRVVAMLASCFEQKNYQQGLVSMVTELTQAFACERVAFAEFAGHYSHVIALSNSASFDDRSNLVQKIAAAMDESIEQDNAIIFPDPKTKLIQRAHQELARKFGTGSICTVPLIYKDTTFGAITLLRSEENPFDQQTLQLCQQTFSLLTPYLALKKEQEKNLFIKIGASLKKQLQNLLGVRHLKLKLGAISALIIISLGSVLQGDFRVSAKAVLEGEIQRVVAAPFSGYLLSAAVRAGDTVSAGDVMASLNDAEIQLQLAKLQGELQKARREYREAQSSRDLVKVRVVSEQINQAMAEIELTQQQIDKINITAPFDGVVIDGDLTQSLGSPVERGEALFKIAPLEGYRIILKVDESQISYIKQGQPGILILPSLSDRDIPLTVQKITVAAKAEDGANIFRVEASLNDSTDQLRPGMQGVGKVEAGRARLIWIWTHEITDWFRLWLWSWLP